MIVITPMVAAPTRKLIAQSAERGCSFVQCQSPSIKPTLSAGKLAPVTLWRITTPIDRRAARDLLNILVPTALKHRDSVELELLLRGRSVVSSSCCPLMFAALRKAFKSKIPLVRPIETQIATALIRSS